MKWGTIFRSIAASAVLAIGGGGCGGGKGDAGAGGGAVDASKESGGGRGPAARPRSPEGPTSTRAMGAP